MEQLKLALSFQPEEKKLHAMLQRADVGEKITKELLQQRIQEEGYDSLFLLNDHIEVIIEKARQNQEFQHIVAETRDPTIKLDVSGDSMSAIITVTPSFGGIPLTKEMIFKELGKEKIIKGILHKKINQIVAAGKAEQIEIARGCPPRNAGNYEFQSLLPSDTEVGPRVDDKGRVNFLDHHQYATVQVGDLLMRRTLPKPARDGFDIFGKLIKAKVERPPPFSSRCKGATVSPDDKNLLVATVKGHPVLIDQGVCVYATLQVPAVNLATGNIDFDGSLHVRGDVGNKMEINVSGDVLVDGIIGGATIKAGGEITVRQGIIGGALSMFALVDKQSSDEETQKKGANLTAGGNISAMFIDNAHVCTKGDICVKEYISHSHLESSKQVQLGVSGGKGNLIGGVTVAREGVIAKVLGSPAYIPTHITIGIEPVLLVNYLSISNQFKSKERQLEELKNILSELEQEQMNSGIPETEKMKEIKTNMTTKIEEFQAELLPLGAQLKELHDAMAGSENAYLLVKENIYDGVRINLKDQSVEAKESLKPGKYRLEDDKIVYSPNETKK